MSFPHYPKYKDSGVEWLGQVPEQWDVIKSRRLFSQQREEAWANDEQLSATQKYGVVPQMLYMEIEDQKLALALSGLNNFKHVEKGDFVISLRSFQGGIELSKYSGCVSPAYTVLRPSNSTVEQYWAYLLKSHGYIKALQTMTDGIRDGKNISYQQFGQIGVPLPQPQEQAAIAAFLDRETAKIDALVAEQQRLLELLKEKRQAVISHAVTRGINPAAALKDSGIEWLGEVPEHWSVIPLKYLVTESVAGPYGASLTKAMYSDSGYRVYGQQQAITNDFTLGDYYITEEKYEEMRRYTVFPNDILISVMGTIGKVAIVPDDAEPGIINPRLVRYRCGDKIVPQFMQTLLLTAQYQELLRLESNGSTMNGLNMRIIGDIPVVVPPMAEQLAILSHLHPTIIKFDTLTSEAQQAIDLFQERRTALISAAVTGQIDVRNSVAVPLALVKPFTSGFARQLLAAEILDHCHRHPTMGRVKLQKLIHLCEHVAEIEEVGAHYARKAAGPFDNKVMFGIATGLTKQKWFAETKDGGRTIYQPLENAGEHRKYLTRWENKMPQINKVLHLLGKADTQQCEIVSTLYAAWNDLLIEGQSPTDETIIHEASSPDRWHENKAKIPPDKWPKALVWMREKGLVPKGFGNHTSRSN